MKGNSKTSDEDQYKLQAICPFKMNGHRFHPIFVSGCWAFAIAVAATQQHGFDSALLIGALTGILVFSILALINTLNLPSDLDNVLVDILFGYGGLCTMLLMFVVLLLNLVIAGLSR